MPQVACKDPESFVREGQILTSFLVDEERENRNSTKIRPSSGCQGKIILMALSWLADGDPTLNAGLVAL